MKPELNSKSTRAGLARFSVLAGKLKLAPIFMSLALLMLVLGALLLLSKSALGWFVISLTSWPFMGLIAINWWLKDLPAKLDATTIDQALTADLLGRLPDNPTPRQLAEAVVQCQGGQFFAARFGIGANFVTQLSSTDQTDTKLVWDMAIELKNRLDLKELSPATMLAALVMVVPDVEGLLAKLQLSLEDLLQGVQWHAHLIDLIQLSKNSRRRGGIGRDLSFGFTPLLDRFAVNITDQVGSGASVALQLEGHADVKQQIVKAMSTSALPHVVLVGGLGVGKSTVIHSLASDLINPTSSLPSSLHFNQIVGIDPTTLIARSSQPGALEVLLNNLLVEAAKSKNMIVFLDNAELFFKQGTGSVDLSNALVPVLDAGGLKIIMAMDQQAWLKLENISPDLTQKLQRVNVPPLEEHDTMLVCQDHLIFTEFRLKVTYMHQAIRAAFRLGKRYVAEQVMPGQAIRILEDAAQFADQGLVTESSVEQAIEKTYGVKVASVNKEEERSRLINLEESLHTRMINQSRAVSVVSNALRRARSGVRNQNKPIGSFLFLGPTGVGKTELSKALAAVYFGGEDRLIRLDLNEFSQPEDVSRLIARPSQDQYSLTAQVSKQPFSVVLLDEIEKAHPNVLDTLLQLLDEGILRDSDNRQVSFKDAIVIATSNAGANTIRQAISSGMKLEDFEQDFTNGLIDSGKFKPEFLNRFDEIVLFRPLTPDELLQVLDLMLIGINSTLSSQHISVDVADDAKRKLVEVGNDPRLGARPMRRMVQRTVENIVANRLLGQTAKAGQVISISLADIDAELKKQ